MEWAGWFCNFLVPLSAHRCRPCLVALIMNSLGSGAYVVLHDHVDCQHYGDYGLPVGLLVCFMFDRALIFWLLVLFLVSALRNILSSGVCFISEY